jgi:protein-L-isoaspartate(D-aspartate) O-methyltransferase
MTLNIELARHNMVEQQVRPWDVLDSRVLEALGSVPREAFVPAAHRALAFADIGLPLGHGEVMMKPVIEGRVLQAVAPARTESVLEIGTGSGFLTACLARMAASVHSVEQHVDLADAARERLLAAHVVNATVETAEAVGAFEPKQQYDVIVVTGAVFSLPQRWREWVRPGGRLLVIVGASPAQRATLFTRAADGAWTEDGLFETDLPYLSHAAPPQRFVL